MGIEPGDFDVKICYQVEEFTHLVSGMVFLLDHTFTLGLQG